MTGILEIKNEKVLKARRIYMKNPHDVSNMNIKKGNKFIFENKEYEVVLFLVSKDYVFLDIDEV
jgi:hypothetical protein